MFGFSGQNPRWTGKRIWSLLLGKYLTMQTILADHGLFNLKRNDTTDHWETERENTRSKIDVLFERDVDMRHFGNNSSVCLLFIFFFSVLFFLFAVRFLIWKNNVWYYHSWCVFSIVRESIELKCIFYLFSNIYIYIYINNILMFFFLFFFLSEKYQKIYLLWKSIN